MLLGMKRDERERGGESRGRGREGVAHSMLA